jgi:predicted nucleic acid-binding Zn ribbon protein
VTWRPLPNSGDGRQPRRLNESLDRISRSLGAPRADVLAAVFARWPDVVGQAIAAHSRPLSLSRGTLVIAVDEPGWAAQLTYLETDLVRRVEEVAGADAVRRVRVTVRPDRAPAWYPRDIG